MGKSYWLKDQDQKGNFSNNKQDTFNPNKKYVGIRLQQGVPLLDRDWNELEDIRRYGEVMLRKHYIGNGSPDNGFKISSTNPASNDFKILAGRCLVDGFEAVNENEIQYSAQKDVPPLNIPSTNRTDFVYLDVWIKETNKDDDPDLGNPNDVDMETCVRHKLEWRVRVDEGGVGHTPPDQYHHYYDIAKIKRNANKTTIENGDIEDLRRTGLKLVDGTINIVGGNVGIGTPSPSEKIQVDGSIYIQGEGRGLIVDETTPGYGRSGKRIGFIKYKGREAGIWRLKNQDFEIGRRLDIQDNDPNIGLPGTPQPASADMVTDLYIAGDGNVGIGTTIPGGKLEVRYGSGQRGLESVGPSGSSHFPWSDGRVYISGADIIFRDSANAERMRMTGAGKVGIGTMNPQRTVDIRGSEINSGGNTVNHGAGFSFHNRQVAGFVETPVNGERWVWYADGTATDGKARLWSGSDKLVVDKAGNVGIGTTTPSMSLQVNNNSLWGRPAIGGQFGNNWSYLHVSDGAHSLIWNSGKDMRFGVETGMGSGYAERIRITSDGNVGIGTANPGQKLHVAGDFVRIDGAGGEQAYIGGDASGVPNSMDVQIGSFNSSVMQVHFWNNVNSSFMDIHFRQQTGHSDRRDKKNIIHLSGALESVMKLQGILFDWKNETPNEKEKKHIGFIAQEVEKVLPQAVSQTNKGTYGINYICLIPVLVEAIKEQQKNIEGLQKTLIKLDENLKTLKKKSKEG